MTYRRPEKESRPPFFYAYHLLSHADISVQGRILSKGTCVLHCAFKVEDLSRKNRSVGEDGGWCSVCISTYNVFVGHHTLPKVEGPTCCTTVCKYLTHRSPVRGDPPRPLEGRRFSTFRVRVSSRGFSPSLSPSLGKPLYLGKGSLK